MTNKKTTKIEKEKNPFIKNKSEILYMLIDSFIAGGLVFFGAFVSNGFTQAGFITAICTSGTVAFLKMQNYFKSNEKKYMNMTKIFNFTGFF
jgi:hypothetical protein